MSKKLLPRPKPAPRKQKQVKMPVEQLRHFGFKAIMTIMGLTSIFHLKAIDQGQDIQIRLQQETNRLLEAQITTQSEQARRR